MPDTFTITLSGGTSTEPWHKKHDPDHLKANLPYKAIVKDQNDKPKTDFAVTITTDVTSNSGGHIHTDGRPKGKLIAGAVASTKAGKESITGKTNGSGIFEFTFGAEEASGTHTLTAKCDSGCQAPATAAVKVEIKDLQLLQLDYLGYYTLRGSTDSHPNNHYFSLPALLKILNLATGYKNEFDQPEYKANFEMPIVINDSSLAKGGTFDVKQDWTSQSNVHGGHRIGIVVDINGIKKRSKLFEILAMDCCQIKANWHKKGTAPHYHLLLLGEGEDH